MFWISPFTIIYILVSLLEWVKTPLTWCNVLNFTLYNYFRCRSRRNMPGRRKRGTWRVSSVTYQFSTIVTIFMRQLEDRCYNSMHQYVNIVSKLVYHGSNVFFLFLGVLSIMLSQGCWTSTNETQIGTTRWWMESETCRWELCTTMPRDTWAGWWKTSAWPSDDPN